MIKILRDVVGVNSGYAVVPFTVENLPDKALTPEAIIVVGESYTVKTDWIRRVESAGEVTVTTVTKEDTDSVFVLRANLQQLDASSVYIRLYNEDTSFISPQIIIAKSEEGTIITKAIELDYRPKTLKIVDSVDCTVNGALAPFDVSNFEIQILASNNSTSTVPVWEDMTTEYFSKVPFEFTNTEKDDGKLWSVAVKYVVRKLSTNSTVEITDIKLIVL